MICEDRGSGYFGEIGQIWPESALLKYVRLPKHGPRMQP